MDTTGTKIMMLEASMTQCRIGIDNGSYDGCKPELNVRKVETLHLLEHIGIVHPLTQAIMSRHEAEKYGCGWGDTSYLYPISDGEIEELLNADRQAVEKLEAFDAANIDKPAKGLCPKCHTYCHGDCESN